jgi:hypothetical protein
MQREFQNKVLRRIFRPKIDEITGKWREMCSEELVLLNKYNSGDQIEKNKMGVAMN